MAGPKRKPPAGGGGQHEARKDHYTPLGELSPLRSARAQLIYLQCLPLRLEDHTVETPGQMTLAQRDRAVDDLVRAGLACIDIHPRGYLVVRKTEQPP